jgi:hypothetical protein
MNFMMVEPIHSKFSAYHFDGTKESALEAVDKWDGVISLAQDIPVSLYKFIFKSGKEILPGDYIVIENNDIKVYKQDEFVRKFRVVYDMRDRIGNFYSMD